MTAQHTKATGFRILVIDDNADIHMDFRKILTPVKQTPTDLEALFLGEAPRSDHPSVEIPHFELAAADQGLAGVEMLQAAMEAGARFDLAFVDMRMPPGLDGVDTIERLWELDSGLPVVICTAYSDYSGTEIFERLGVSDRLQILKKPFDPVEVQHLALSLATRRSLEDQASLRTEELERRVEQRTLDLHEAKDKAEAASRLKSEFLANMSHEIRTPLHGVMGMLELLKESGLAPQQQEYADVSLSSARSLLALINDILDYSKIEASQLQLDEHPFCLRRMAEELITISAAQKGDRSVDVVLDYCDTAPSLVVGDSLRIRQVLTNLVSNALKFTQSGEVVLDINAVACHDNISTFRFAVRDTGIGIPEDKLSVIFGKFAQADSSTTRQYGGTGLGLAISQQLIHMMGGRIHVCSEPGRGAEFSFHLQLPVCCDLRDESHADLLTSAPPQGLPSGDPTNPDDRPVVLLADDNEVNRVVAGETLKLLGCEVVMAVDGRQALELMSQQAFSIVLMDCQMPVMDGYEATQSIRQLAGPARSVPVIALTAHAMAGDRDKCLEAGMNDYLAKPFTLETLQKKLERWTGRSLTPETTGS
ncbi:MAG: response regulator [Planctomycetaceae bacterium]|nr:response regulator [Planctomycetaceae bacterium]